MFSMSKLKCFFCVKICVEPWTKTPRCKECHQERLPSSCRRHNRTSKCPRATGWPWTEISLIFKLKRIVATMTRMQQESLQGRGVYRAQFVPPQKQWFCLIFCPEAPGFFTDLKSFVEFCWFLSKSTSFRSSQLLILLCPASRLPGITGSSACSGT